MADNTGRYTGEFKGDGNFAPPTGVLQFDGWSASTYISRYTNGWVIANPITPPQRSRQWELLGLTVNVRLGLSIQIGTGTFKRWGRLGKLWAGINVGGDLSTQFVGTNLPGDLSNFTVIWDGDTDPIRLVPDYSTGIFDFTPYSIISNTFMFPQPVLMGWESNIQVGLIQTPSLIGIDARGGGGSTAHVVLVVPIGATYTLIYNEHSRGKNAQWY